MLSFIVMSYIHIYHISDMGQRRLVTTLFLISTISYCDGQVKSLSWKHEKYPQKLNQLETLARSEAQNQFTRGIDGGVSCAACSVLLGMAVQLGETRHESDSTMMILFSRGY